MKPVYGIDFGTSNSAVAIWYPDTGKVKQGKYESSLIYFEPGRGGQQYIGDAAVLQYLEHGMRGRFMKSLKSLLPASTFSFTTVFGRRYYTEDLIALILRHYKAMGDQISGQDVREVVIGRPARFSPDPVKDKLAEDRLRKGAEKAGFSKIHFQYEPIAAAYAYERSLKQDELVLVGDFGGGTTDFTLMRLSPTRSGTPDRAGDILATDGIKVGGDRLDAAIAWDKVVQFFGKDLTYDSTGRGKFLPLPTHYFRKLCRWEEHIFLGTRKNLLDIRNYHRWTGEDYRLEWLIYLLENHLGYALSRSVEAGKIGLTSADHTEIRFEEGPIRVLTEMTIRDFGKAIRAEMGEIGHCLDAVMAAGGVTPEHVDAVFLTGGSSLVRPIRDLFAQRFGEGKLREQDTFYSVVQGLALSAVLY